MNHQFKVGDSAMIKVSANPAHLGRGVEILELLIDDKGFYIYGGIGHQGEADGSACAFVDLPGDGPWLYALKALMPLRGDPDPVGQKVQELVHEQ